MRLSFADIISYDKSSLSPVMTINTLLLEHNKTEEHLEEVDQYFRDKESEFVHNDY